MATTTTSPPPQQRFVVCDAGVGLRGIAASEAAALVVTSPPYFGCRDYAASTNTLSASHTGASNALGHETTPYEYARHLADIFGHASSAHYLRQNGSLVIVIGDTFARKMFSDPAKVEAPIVEKSVIGINYLFCSEMRRRGWRLWQEIIWSKPSAPPSGAARFRCNPCHEYVLWFDRNMAERPFFDSRSIREEGKTKAGAVMPPVGGKKYGDYKKPLVSDGQRCRQSVWSICPSRDKSAHVAPFPEDFPELWIRACTSDGDTVCDPFAGTRTVERVAKRAGRGCVSFDLRDYIQEKSSLATMGDGGGGDDDDDDDDENVTKRHRALE